MRRTALLAVIAALAVSVPGADAAPMVLDGQKRTEVTLTEEAPIGAATTDPADADVAACAAPKCGRLEFVYRPATRALAAVPLTVELKVFFMGITDVDLYLLDGATVVGSCKGTFSTHRWLQVAPAGLKAGKTYTAVMFYSHGTQETVRMTASLPGTAEPDQISPDTLSNTVRVYACGT